MDCAKQKEEIEQLKQALEEQKQKNEKLLQECAKVDAMNELFNKYTITSETDLDGIITYASEPFIEISGYSKEELIGQPHNIVRHEDMPKEAFKELWETIQNKKIWRGEVKNRKKNGGHYWVDSIVFPLLDANGNIEAYKSIRIDITHKKELHDVLGGLMSVEENLF